MLLKDIKEFYSPIINIKEHIIRALESCAPEKNEKLNEIISKNDINFVLNDNVEKSKLKFSADVENKIVNYSVKSLEFLWCLCFISPIIYENYLEKKELKNDSILNPNYKIDTAEKLLQWAISSIDNDTYVGWDDSLPYPLDKEDENIFQLSNELFYLALSWLYLHEIGHIYHGHKSMIPSERVSEENEADEFANKYMLDTNTTKKKILIRKLGIGIANIVILILDIQKLKLVSDDYPHTFGRLINNINYGEEFSETYQEFYLNVLAQILKHYMINKGILISKETKDPYAQLISYYQDVNKYVNKKK